MYVKILSALIATATVLGIMWAAADYADVRPVIEKEFIGFVETQQRLSDNLLLLRFQVLAEKAKTGSLSFDELQEYCALVRALEYVGIEECD